MKIEHVGLSVQDLEQTVAFYETYFEAMAAERYHKPKTTFTSRFLSFPAGVCTSGVCLGVARGGH